jgi:exopolyphosphatase/guanosine-5'-triphosphate,3'-diphosphate pyrophosphatase
MRTMRVATIDLGTNTALLLIVESGPRGPAIVAEEAEIVRLGEKVDRTGRLDDAAMARTLAVLERYGERIRKERVDRIAAVGTQTLREVSNGAAFLEKVEAAIGAPLEVIDGKREAELSWGAVAASFSLPSTGRRTVLDIGGGSTELNVGGATLERSVSVPIGSVRLTERLLKHDPPTEEERGALAAFIDQALLAAPIPEGELVGVAGTVTTIAAIALGMTDYDGARVHGVRMARAQIEEIVARLGESPVADRKRTPGLDPRRADVIYAGGVILCRVLARGGQDELLVSDRGIRWGLAAEILPPMG